MKDQTNKTPHQVIGERVDELLLKLLDGVERDIGRCALPSDHLKAYEVLCRAEKIRLG